MKIFNCKSCGAPLDNSFICCYCGTHHFKKDVSNDSKHITVNQLRSAFDRQKKLEVGCDYAVGIYRGGVRL